MAPASRALRITALITFAACAQPEAAPPVDTAADVAAVNAVRDAEVAAINAGDASSTYLSADAVLMPPGEPAVNGRDAASMWMGAFIAQFKATVNYTRNDVTVSGDWAIERYAGTLAVTPVGGGDTVNEVLKGLHIYRREAGGSWKMVYDMWNSDAPPPQM